ncbi:Hypothetical_protein [Hexamita inflata]|uniref:Hypothetical_protein n=1 Tax=Hexamita inflata TaxID=28002 RepID=A0AA86QIG7_9EUKA|nr:Hypothetical protein HINF_LOCUS44532 [Hexamita inflata]
MNTVQNLEIFINDPQSTKYQQLLQFINYAGKSRCAPTIIDTNQKQYSFTDNSEISEQNVIHMSQKHNNILVAPSQVFFSKMLDCQESNNISNTSCTTGANTNDQYIAQINSGFDLIQVSYLRSVKRANGILKRMQGEGLKEINDSFISRNQ